MIFPNPDSYYIPDPQFVPVPYNLNGKSFWQRLWYIAASPPRFKLTRDWIVHLPGGITIVVPKGFLTDFASIPRVFWAVPGFSPSGPLLWGAILHDFAYQYGYLLQMVGRTRSRIFEGFPQEFFDDMLRTVTRVKTGAVFTAWAAHKALSIFGDTVWDEYRTKGPSAYNTNSLGLPGLIADGGEAI